MSIALTDDSAAVLFDTIDEVLGIFEKETMTRDDWKYWAVFRQNFINTFTDEVPSVFWFESKEVPSVVLHLSGTSFSVTSELSQSNPSVAGRLYDVNRRLSQFNERLAARIPVV